MTETEQDPQELRYREGSVFSSYVSSDSKVLKGGRKIPSYSTRELTLVYLYEQMSPARRIRGDILKSEVLLRSQRTVTDREFDNDLYYLEGAGLIRASASHYEITAKGIAEAERILGLRRVPEQEAVKVGWLQILVAIIAIIVSATIGLGLCRRGTGASLFQGREPKRTSADYFTVVHTQPEGVAIRRDPHPSSELVATAGFGTRVAVVEGYQLVEGIPWRHVWHENHGYGWLPERLPDGSLVLQDLAVHETVTVVYGSPVYCRSSPGYVGKAASDVVCTLEPGADTQIVAGPSPADGLVWWQVECPCGQYWVAGTDTAGNAQLAEE